MTFVLKAQPQSAPSPLPRTPLIILDLELKGTFTAKGIEPYAVILDKKTKKDNLVVTGDTIAEATVKTIQKERVMLLINDQEKWLLLTSKRTAEDETPKLETPFRTETTVSWDDIDSIRENVLSLARQIRIHADFHNENSRGLRISYLKEESWLSSKAGLKEGDVITAINDKQIISEKNIPNPYDLLEQIESSEGLQLDVLRDNLPGKLNITIE